MSDRCGTVRGYFDHREAGEKTCADCRQAKRDYQNERRDGYGTCKVPDCGRPVAAIELCATHVSRHYVNGSAYYERASKSELFWRHVDIGTEPEYAPELGACWVWVGGVYLTGYGKFGDAVLGKQYYAHRFAYEDMVSEIPDGLTIDHLCRVRRCVNPYHLEPVTNEENVRRAHQARKELACQK